MTGPLRPSWSPGDIANGDLAHDAFKHLIDGQLRGIQLYRVGRRLERGHRTLGIALIARTDLIQQVLERILSEVALRDIAG